VTPEDRFRAYRIDLEKFEASVIADTYFTNHTRVPYVFEGREHKGAEFKRQLATAWQTLSRCGLILDR
jgi:hypothetical protein